MRTYKDIKAEYREFLANAHLTPRHRDEARKVWISHHTLSLVRPFTEKWDALYKLEHSYNNDKFKLNGKDIQKALRQQLLSLQDGRCCYCRKLLQNTNHARPVEHVIPKGSYPQFSLQYRNLAVACFDCNQTKLTDNWCNIDVASRVYPKSGGGLDYFHPRLHIYDNHIRFFRHETNSITVSVYVGKTEQGKHLCANLLAAISKKEMLIRNNKRLASYIEVLQKYAADADTSNKVQVAELVKLIKDRLIRVTERYG